MYNNPKRPVLPLVFFTASFVLGIVILIPYIGRLDDFLPWKNLANNDHWLVLIFAHAWFAMLLAYIPLFLLGFALLAASLGLYLKRKRGFKVTYLLLVIMEVIVMLFWSVNGLFAMFDYHPVVPSICWIICVLFIASSVYTFKSRRVKAWVASAAPHSR